MSMPPQGGWQSPLPGSVPPNQGGPYQGSPGPNPQQPYMGQQPSGYSQVPWPQQGVPPQKGNSLKWLLVAIAVLLVIAVTIGATLLFTRGDGGDTPPAPSTSASPGDIASADDTGPVSIVTDEPTCKSINAINNGLSDVQANGWAEQHSALGPATEWTSEQRQQVQAVATAMRNASDQAVALAKQTPHRVIRELYEQFIAYSRAYADSIDSYIPVDDALATASVTASSALIGICNTIEYGSTKRSLSLSPAPAPTSVTSPEDPNNPKPFISSSNETCLAWIDRLDTFNATTSPEWQNRDGSVPGSQWTPERRAIEQATKPLLLGYADETEASGRQSGNPVLEDFASTIALYVRAYAAAGESYVSADGWLNYSAFQIANLVSAACRAVTR